MVVNFFAARYWSSRRGARPERSAPQCAPDTTTGISVAGGVLRLRPQRTCRRSSPCPRPGCRRAARSRAGPARAMLGAVHEHEIGIAADLDQAAVELADLRGVAGREAEHQLGRDVRRSTTASRPCARMPSGCTPEPAGPSVPRITRCGHLSSSRLGGRDRHLLVAVVHDLDRARALLAELAHMGLGQRGVAAVDVADDVGIGLEHHVLVDQARARDRGAARVDRALDAVLCAPRPPSPLAP